MNTLNIGSLTEEDLWEIEDSISGAGEKIIDGGGKKEHKGPKTSREIGKFNKENAEKKRVDEAKSLVIKDLEKSPINNISVEERINAVDFYAEWVKKSLEQGYPYISNIDKEIEFTQTRSSGPGGQNVNKTSTAVIAKHLLTGIYARSESREMLNNKRDSLSKVLEKLEIHIKNWKIYLGSVSEEDRINKIKNLVESVLK